jgi:hypothetical protein
VHSSGSYGKYIVVITGKIVILHHEKVFSLLLLVIAGISVNFMQISENPEK